MKANTGKGILDHKWFYHGNSLELEEEFDAVVSELGFDELWVTDHEGNVIKVNKKSESFCEVTAAEIIGKNVKELEKMGLFSPSVTVKAIEKKRRVTMVQTTKSGKKLILSSTPIFNNDDQIVRFVNQGWDITGLNNLRQRVEETEKLLDIYQNEISKLRNEKMVSEEIITASPVMQSILKVVERVALVDSTILVGGESGVGKGIIAGQIHKLSYRRSRPFITINCGAIPETLFESEVFGYEPGSFTGARKEGKKGLLEAAQGGTVFFDEVSELPLSIQVKLLHVIQEKRMMRVGGEEAVNVDIRIIAATNKDLKKMVSEGKFREDLFYRLNVVPLEIPPLRQRKEDIPVLSQYFCRQINIKYGFHKKLSSNVIEILDEYDWPGNVRELENLIERLLVTTEDHEILPEHLPAYICDSSGYAQNVIVLNLCPLNEAIELLERQLLKKALLKYKNTSEIAKALGVSQSTIVRKMQRYCLK